MSNTLMRHLPWIAPTLAILAVGSGLTDRIYSTFDQLAGDSVAEAAVEPDIEAAVAAVAAPEPAPVPSVAPENVSQQLAALLQETEAEAAAEEALVTRNAGFSIDVLNEARDAALAAQPTGEQATQQPLDADFFSAAQANIERDRRCVDDLRALAAQARVYFPSGGVSGEQAGIEQARLLGVLAQQCQGITIQVSGHSDPSGDPALNQQLSLERAEAVITRVAASGIDVSLFRAVGMGDTVPSGLSGPEPASYYDRRVEFSVIETPVQASFVAPAFGTPGTQFQTAACVAQLERAVAGAAIEYAPRGMTPADGDFSVAVQLARIAANCPEARLRVIGQFSDDPGAGEDASTGRLRAVVLMTRLVGQGVPSEQIILAAPSEPQPVSGLSDSRVDFDVILEEL